MPKIFWDARLSTSTRAIHGQQGRRSRRWRATSTLPTWQDLRRNPARYAAPVFRGSADRRRLRELTALGWQVYHVTRDDLGDMDRLVRNIAAAITARRNDLSR